MANLPRLSGALGKLAGNSTVTQLALWSIVSPLVTAAASPIATELEKGAYQILSSTPLSPADLATAVNRGFMDEGAAESQARSSGINVDQFKLLVELAGQAPSPGILAEAERRGYLKDGSDPKVPYTFEQGIRQGNLRNVWSPLMKALSVQEPSPNDALQAYLEGQIEEGEAKDLFQKFGGDIKYFDMMYNTRGNAPSPIDAAHMAMRGIIDWSGSGAGKVSYEQAFLEGPWRNKWEEPYKRLAEFVPTLPEISNLYTTGAITEEEAVKYMSYRGADKTIALAYLNRSKNDKVSKQKELTLSTVENLYFDKLIKKETAVSMIEALGYTADEAAYILALIDLRRQEQALRQALSRIHSLYTAHKIDKTLATNALNAIEIPANEVIELIKTWTLERQANVKTLTPTQVARAFKEQIISQAEAQTELEQMGYQPYDAWVFLSMETKTILPGKPPKTAITLSTLS
jgi:hypothetical protein